MSPKKNQTYRKVGGDQWLWFIKNIWWHFLIALNECQFEGFVSEGGRGEGAICTWAPLLTYHQPFHLHRLYIALCNRPLASSSSSLTVAELFRYFLPGDYSRTWFHTIGLRRVIWPLLPCRPTDDGFYFSCSGTKALQLPRCSGVLVTFFPFISPWLDLLYITIRVITAVIY